MPGVNLAPGTQHIVAARKRRRRLFAVTWILIILLVVVWAGLFLYSQQLERQLVQTESRLQTVQTEIARLNNQAKRVEQFEAQLASLSALLNQHVVLEPVLQSIEGRLPPSLRLESLAIHARDGSVQIVGATSDIDQVAQAIASFNSGSLSDAFSNVEFGSVQRAEQAAGEDEQAEVNYGFTIDFSFDPSLVQQQ